MTENRWAKQFRVLAAQGGWSNQAERGSNHGERPARSRVAARGQRSSPPIGRATSRPAIRLSHWPRANLVSSDWSVGSEVREANWAVGGQRGQWVVARGQGAGHSQLAWAPLPISCFLKSFLRTTKGQECCHINISTLT